MDEVTVQQVVRIEKKLGRLELLNWLNEMLRTDYAKVQDCADGIAYCQLVDSLAPGLVPLHKLSFTTRTLDDNMKNLRILEEAMHKLGVRKDIDVPGIAKGKFQENNEFLQWIHALLQKNTFVPPDRYKAFERRWAAQERQKEGGRGTGNRPKGRQHQLNNNLVPNEFEWHEGPVREAPAQAKPPVRNGAKPAGPGADSTKRRSSVAVESTISDLSRQSKGPVSEAPELAAPSKSKTNRASAERPLPGEGRLPARGSDDWKGLDERVSWTGGALGQTKEAWLADPPFRRVEQLPIEEVKVGGGNEQRSRVEAGESLRGDDGGARGENESTREGRESVRQERMFGNGQQRIDERNGEIRTQSGLEWGTRRGSDEAGESGRRSGVEGEGQRENEGEGPRTSVQEGGGAKPGAKGGAQTRRQQAELESLIAYLESELVTRLQAFADLKKEVKLVDQERKFYYEKLRRIEKLCEHADSVDAVTQTVLHVVDILSSEEDCPAIKS